MTDAAPVISDWPVPWHRRHRSGSGPGVSVYSSIVYLSTLLLGLGLSVLLLSISSTYPSLFFFSCLFMSVLLSYNVSYCLSILPLCLGVCLMPLCLSIHLRSVSLTTVNLYCRFLSTISRSITSEFFRLFVLLFFFPEAVSFTMTKQ